MSRLQPGPHNCISESIQVLTKSHPGINLPPCRSHLNSMKVPILTSHLNPGSHICVWPSYRRYLNSIQVPNISSQPHTDTISDPSGFQNARLTGILFLFHLNPELKNIISPPSMHLLTSIQVHRFPSHIQPGDIWTPSRSHKLTSRIHPDRVSSQSRFRHCLHITSIQVISHLHLDPPNGILSPSRCHLKFMQVSTYDYYLHPCPASASSMSKDSCLSYIHVPTHLQPGSNILLCIHTIVHLHPRPISSPSRPIYSWLTSIQVLSQSNPGPDIYISPHSRWCLNSIQVLKTASELLLGHI